MTMKKNSELWVFIEINKGVLARVSLELLSKAVDLNKKAQGVVAAFVIGQGAEKFSDELIHYGADKVIIAQSPVAKDYRTEVYTRILADHAKKNIPEILLIGATGTGRDLAPRLSARLNTGCTTDCTDLNIDNDTGLLVATKPFFGRDVMADIECPRHIPQVISVRPGVVELKKKDNSRKGDLVFADVNIKEEDVKIKILETISSPSDEAALQDAEKVVAGGMGICDAAGFEILKRLADMLGAEVGGTTVPVEAGLIPHERLIGQTGKTIRPKLYIGCGISGAIQHSAGMINSEIIVAINNNPDAEIFDFSDYGFVGDAYEIIPAIISELEKHKSN